MEEESSARQPLRRGVYLLPNLLTTAAMFAGFYAIIAAADGNFERAGIAVFVAMIFDGLDGRVARWTSTESAFGKEFDSLSDMVSFGLAPALVIYQWCFRGIELAGLDEPVIWSRCAWLAAFFFAVAAALRLARFNTRTPMDKRYFEGLPSPSAAAIVASFVWFSTEWRDPGMAGIIVGLTVTIVAGALMVSRFAYYAFKQINLGGKVPFAYIVLVPLAFVLIAIEPPRMLFVLFGLYALSGPVVWIYRRLRRRPAQDVAPRADS